ncbi:hypothetical protein HK098_002689 [Nowakowskiella sp. JEL0407]|nr:hypothetical protein HK098_002689 [Nowakowskiella sp. JEL0407]
MSCYSCVRLSEKKISLETYGQGKYTLSNFIGGRCASECPPLYNPGDANSKTKEYIEFLSQIGNAPTDVRGCFYGYSLDESKPEKPQKGYGFYYSNVTSSGTMVYNCPTKCIEEAQNGRSAFTPIWNVDDFLPECKDTFPPYLPKLTTTISTSPSVTDSQLEVIKSNNNSETSIGAIVGGSIAGAIVIIAVVLGAVFFVRRRNLAKNQAYRAIQTTQNVYYPPPLAPASAVPYMAPPPVVTKQLPIVGFILVPSRNISSFDHVSETSALDDVDSLNDQIHRFAYTILGMFPTASFAAKSLKSSPGLDVRAANIAGLKRIFARTLKAKVFDHFTEEYPKQLAQLLFDNKILETHRDRCKVDDNGVMEVEPETVYYAALKLADTKPPKFEAVPDREIAKIVQESKGAILNDISKERDVQIDEKIQKAVEDIVAAAVLVVIKLKVTDASYSAFLPVKGAPFDGKRMRANGSGQTVVFAETCGWEKNRGEEVIVKIPSNVWVQ